MFTLAEDLTQMELQVDVDEADVGQVREGQEATFTVDAYPDRTFPARITQVRYGSQTVEGVVTYKTVLKVDNTSLALRPGMTATAVITVNKRDNVVLVPNAAMRFVPTVKEAAGSSRGGGLVGMLLPRPPGMNDNKTEEPDTKKKEQQVWTMRGGTIGGDFVHEGSERRATDGGGQRPGRAGDGTGDGRGRVQSDECDAANSLETARRSSSCGA